MDDLVPEDHLLRKIDNAVDFRKIKLIIIAFCTEIRCVALLTVISDIYKRSIGA